MHFPAAGIFHNIVLVSIDKRYPGHARKIMNAFWGLGQLMFSKTIIVVDKDVDVQNEAEVAWIVGTHYDPERDVQFTRGPVDDLEDASDLAGVRQQDGNRRDAEVAVGRVHAPLAEAHRRQRSAPRRRPMCCGRRSARAGKLGTRDSGLGTRDSGVGTRVASAFRRKMRKGDHAMVVAIDASEAAPHSREPGSDRDWGACGRRQAADAWQPDDVRPCVRNPC